jgi:hypothetical protein
MTGGQSLLLIGLRAGSVLTVRRLGYVQWYLGFHEGSSELIRTSSQGGCLSVGHSARLL